MNLLPAPQTAPKMAAPVDPQGPNLFKSARERPMLAALTLVLAIGVALPAAWVLGAPRYYAESIVYVSPTFIKNLASDTEQEMPYGTFVQQQVHSINRFDIMFESLRRLKALGKPWNLPGEGEQAAAERLQRSLTISWVPDTYQIAVGMASKTPSNSALVLNTVVAVFLEKAKEEEFFGGNERIEILSAEKQSLERQLTQNSTEIARISKNLGLVSLDQTSENNYDQLLLKSREALSVARQQRIEAEAKLATATGPRAREVPWALKLWKKSPGRIRSSTP